MNSPNLDDLVSIFLQPLRPGISRLIDVFLSKYGSWTVALLAYVCFAVSDSPQKGRDLK